MPITYFDSATTGGSFGTNGTNSGTGEYKDLTITGAQAGDLIVVGAANEQSTGSQTRSITTQSGSTGAWTLIQPAVVNNSDVDVIGGWALVSSAGSVTVRALMRSGSTFRMGVAAWLIPAAEIGATYGFVGSGFVGDTDTQTSVTLTGSSTVLLFFGDWTAKNLGSTLTPSGGTVDRTYYDTAWYSVGAADWETQGAGTRNYGFSGLSSMDASGWVFRMDTASSGTPASMNAAPLRASVVSPSPVVTAGSAVNATPGGAASRAPAPTVTAAVTLFAPPMGVDAGIQAPTVTAAATVQAAPTGAMVAITPPTVVAGTPATVNARPMGATISTPSPTVIAGATITATASSASARTPAPTVSTGTPATITAPPMGVTVTAPASVVHAAVQLTAPVTTVVARMPAPVVTATATVTVTAQPLRVNVRLVSPTVTAGAEVALQPARAVVFMGVPTIGGIYPHIPYPRTLVGTGRTGTLTGHGRNDTLTGTSPDRTLEGSTP